MLTANIHLRLIRTDRIALSYKSHCSTHNAGRQPATIHPDRMGKCERRHNIPRVTPKRHRSTGTEAHHMHHEYINFQFHPAKNQSVARPHIRTKTGKTASPSSLLPPPNVPKSIE